ncbi:LD-carboxypeptidase [Burkholderia sp. AU42008]|uniref:S66 peptidase family protein n=1 Tax=unclassified Burkholderia TaxID=2613784 RepID=UPI000B79EB49|nr:MULTISPECIES: LD-carboxypeptidase [unclassified Burkholderia]MBR8234919.1 LD-carboxypeptidase [Burkholderia sp. AU32357]MBY4875856.1 LD-carboxypeptidase [Burkholderia sp. AU42008]OXI39217.1 LD-carboxypeptidase [Burkholderia sp. AU17457]
MESRRKTVRVVAPAGVPDPQGIERGIALVESWGFKVTTSTHLGSRYRYFAGTAEERADDLRCALMDPSVDIVWLARGGFGCAHLLEHLPDEIATPKTIVGFSDATSLFCALADRPGVRLLHGPTFHSLASKVDDATRADMRAVLTGGKRAPLSLRHLSGAPGAVRGRLCGGNVTVLASVAGTRWPLRSRDAIVLLEDVTEFGYRLDRSLTQLRLSGAFDGARALMLGQFTRCPVPDGADFTLEQMLVDVLGGLGLPIYSGLPIGHEHRNITWQYGQQAAIENSAIRFVA